MNENHSEVREIVIRYLLIVFVSLFAMKYLEQMLSFSTITVLTGLLKYLYGDVGAISRYVLVDDQIIEITRECVMGLLYWMLFVLVFTTAKLSLSRRFAALFMAGTLMFVSNIIRMIFLISIVKMPYFNGVHGVFQYIVAPLWLFLVWIITIRLLNIEAVPVYSDAKYLWDLMDKKKSFWKKKIRK